MNPTADLTPDERERIAPFVTDTVGPVFALTNLPEVVKGALFARYSRSPKSLRRLLIDEFLPPESAAVEAAADTGEEPGRGAVRPGARRVRGRLGGPARRGAHRGRGRLEHPDEGPRVGAARELPRAVHALHPARRPPGRSSPLSPSRAGHGRPRARAPVRRDARRRLRPVLGAHPPARGALRGGRARRARHPARRTGNARFGRVRSMRCVACCRRRPRRMSASSPRGRRTRPC